MKLTGRDARRYLAAPDPARAGVLLYGPDAMRVALRRQEVVAALIGPEGEAEMRLTRLAAGDLRGDPAAAADAVRARGFFPGPRVVLVEEATDAAAGAIGTALADRAEGDAILVVTARPLTPRSGLRKLFEGHPTAAAIGIYDDPPTRDEIAATLARAGLGAVGRAAQAEIEALAAALDPGEFAQTVEKLALYKLGDETEVTPADIAACAPASREAATDTLIHAVAEGETADIAPLLRRLAAQGTGPVAIAIAATRHFRTLHAAAADPSGPAAAIGKVRPPVHFKARDRMARQARSWGVTGLEGAIGDLLDTDLALRSSTRAPQMALIERTLMRLAMRARRG